jgi:hypothetical protein
VSNVRVDGIDEDSDDFPGDKEASETCDVCGADLSLGYPDPGGCPFCLPCGGDYAPGSEECDCCDYSGECARNC